MVDSKNLTEAQLETLRHISYEQQVMTYDALCSTCPYADIRVIKHGLGYPVKDLQEAIDIVCAETLNTYSIHRGCGFGGEEITMKEITMNSCRFWSGKRIETDNVDNCFIVLEVE